MRVLRAACQVAPIRRNRDHHPSPSLGNKLKILKRDQTTSPLLLHAGQQLVEHLTFQTALSGETRESVAAALLAEPGMRAVTVKKNEANAGKAAFPPETHHFLTTLRHRLRHWLSSKSPAPRDRWHDPRPKAHLSEAVKVIELVK